MNLEERLKSSRNNINPNAYNGKSNMIDDTSKLNIDAIPSRYNNTGKLASLPDTSKLNIDKIPSRYAPK